MRAKLVSDFSIYACLAVLATGCEQSPNSSSLGAGTYLAEDLLSLQSGYDIKRSLDMTAKQEISAGKTKYLFCERYPYRGSPTTVVYCYEMITERNNQWLLRGYFPINIGDVYRDHVTSKRNISYEVDGESAKLLCNGVVMFTISSVSEMIRKRESDPQWPTY